MGNAALVVEDVQQGGGCSGEVCGGSGELDGWDQGAAVRPLLAPALLASCPQAMQAQVLLESLAAAAKQEQGQGRWEGRGQMLGAAPAAALALSAAVMQAVLQAAPEGAAGEASLIHCPSHQPPLPLSPSHTSLHPQPHQRSHDEGPRQGGGGEERVVAAGLPSELHSLPFLLPRLMLMPHWLAARSTLVHHVVAAVEAIDPAGGSGQHSGASQGDRAARNDLWLELKHTLLSALVSVRNLCANDTGGDADALLACVGRHVVA